MPLLPRIAVSYATTSDGLNIAFTQVGDTGPVVVLVPGVVSQLEVAWEEPAFASFVARLAAGARVIVLDRRGIGLSDPLPGDRPPSLQDLRDDVVAVLDGTGTTEAALFGFSMGAAVAVRFAVDLPGRCSAMVLVGGMARWAYAPDHTFGIEPAALDSMVTDLAAGWGGGASVPGAAPSMVDDDRFCRWAARLERHSCPPGVVRAAFEQLALTDVRTDLAQVRSPTLVVHRTGDRMVPVEHGRHLARSIRDAGYVELEGADHLFFVGDQRAIADAMIGFLRETCGFAASSTRGQAPFGLSEGEREVVELVTLGLANAEIARRLFISRYTVDARLRRAFSKLMVANRAELAARAAVGL